MPYNDEEYVLEYSHKPKIQIKGNTYYFPINSGYNPLAAGTDPVFVAVFNHHHCNLNR